MNLSKLVVVGLMLSSMFLVVGCEFITPVFFPDHALESAIRAELRKPFGLLTQNDLLQVRILDGRQLGIEDLTGIEYCRNLAWLDLDSNRITNLKPLEQLGRPENPFDSPLTYLNLDSNQLTDITPLAGLLNLQGVSLFDNQIMDIAPLVVNAQSMGLGEGDYVILDVETMSEQAITVDIPLLMSFGVNVVGAVPAGSEE